MLALISSVQLTIALKSQVWAIFHFISAKIWKKPRGIIYHPVWRGQILHTILNISFQNTISKLSPVSKLTAYHRHTVLEKRFLQNNYFSLYALNQNQSQKKMCLKLSKDELLKNNKHTYAHTHTKKNLPKEVLNSHLLFL